MRMAARGIGLLWAFISWPIVVLLALLEPFVRGILYGFALLGALAALFLRFVGNRADVPLFTVFAVCIGCLVAAGIYSGPASISRRDPRRASLEQGLLLGIWAPLRLGLRQQIWT